MPRFPDEITYSEKYSDEVYEFRYVSLPKEIYYKIRDKEENLTEDECIDLGIQQSEGWVNYGRFAGEPYILLFRRPLGVNHSEKEIPNHIKKKIEQYENEKIAYLNMINPEINYDDYK